MRSERSQTVSNGHCSITRRLVAMTSHKQTRRFFSVNDIREGVSNEISFEQLFEAFVVFEAFKAAHTNSRALEAWLVGKYGLATSVKCLSFVRSAMCLPKMSLYEVVFPTLMLNISVCLRRLTARPKP